MTNETLLLVAPEAATCSWETEALRRAGYEVIHVATRENAIKELAAESQFIALVVIDIELDEVLTACETARNIVAEYAVPLLFLSSHTDSEIITKLEAISGYGYVAKCGGEAALLSGVSTAVRLHRAHCRIEDYESEVKRSHDHLECVSRKLEATRSELLQKDQELWESERKFKSIIEGLPLAVFVGIHGRFAYLNPAAVEFFGARSVSELFGTVLGDRIHPDHYTAVAERVRRLQRGESVLDAFDHKWIRVDGATVWGETIGEPITYAGKKAAIVVIRDTTHQKEYGEEIDRWKGLMEQVYQRISRSWPEV